MKDRVLSLAFLVAPPVLALAVIAGVFWPQAFSVSGALVPWVLEAVTALGFLALGLAVVAASTVFALGAMLAQACVSEDPGRVLACGQITLASSWAAINAALFPQVAALGWDRGVETFCASAVLAAALSAACRGSGPLARLRRFAEEP